MKCRRLALVALATLVPLAPLGVAAAPKNSNAVIKSEKKPGKTCGNFAHGSDAYKQCIQAQAHTGQKPKKP
jgi:hypothetical protein